MNSVVGIPALLTSHEEVLTSSYLVGVKRVGK